MQKLFNEVGSLDKRCYEEFGLSEDILMEHAANGIADFIRAKFEKNSKITVACGSGNNGADGIALARLLHGDYDVNIFYVNEPKSEMAKLQKKRSSKVGVKTTIELNDCDVLVDALYGTGFKGEFNYEAKAVLQTINKLDAYKIACDIPSGLKADGSCDKDSFIADISLTMGALKKSMYSDKAKDFVGDIEILDLGISRILYEGDTNWNLLDLEDLELPYRNQKDTHKGSYGHLALACGDKIGASIMSSLSALRFGAGLVTLVGDENRSIPHAIMFSDCIPKTTTALACGMGLGEAFDNKRMEKFLDNNLPLVVDADVFHMPIVLDILKRENIVLTPHAKEFVSLLKQTKLADISVEELQQNRFKYIEIFTNSFPHATILLKGANVILACGSASAGYGDKFYINPHGTSALAKAGSGDILSGLVGALLAQGYSPLKSAINASLAHTKLVQNYKGADFSLTPEDLIAGISKL